jgi:KDO2-lipid IV(A) lauroyltransferase
VSGVDYAPHRRLARGRLRGILTRAWERVVVLLFRGTSAAVSRTPLTVSEPVARLLFRLGYHLWPQKRAIIHRNASHVLGLPEGDPRVGALARAIYASYSRFALELIRLPGLPDDEPVRLMRMEGPDHEAFLALWERCQAEGRGIIAVSGHIGSIEIFAGAYAARGIPTYGLADDSAFPELFETLTRARARWGVTIIPWRHLRDIFRVLRSPVALGMVVDWGYRPDDLPVRLMGTWTTLPAGPATLTLLGRARLMTARVLRVAPDQFRARGEWLDVELSGDRRADIATMTQRIAERFEAAIAEAPEQWWGAFQPIWPDLDGGNAS